MFPLHDDNPTEIFPFVTIAIIATCTVVFFWQIGHSLQAQKIIAMSLGVIPAALLSEATRPPVIHWIPEGLTIFTSMFLHGGWMHLIGNMIFLWIFGNNIEDAMGHFRFLLFYLICGVLSVLAFAVPVPNSQIPLIGASGAISGVVGAYLLLYPHARVLVVIPIWIYLHATRLPAMLVIGLWFVMQIFSSVTEVTGGGGVAWGAHIGGFIAGMVLVLFFRKPGVQLFQPPRTGI